MKGIKSRVSIMFKNEFDSGNTEDIIKNIKNVNEIIDEIDDYYFLSISCEQAQMKTNKIQNFNDEDLESFESKMKEKDNTSFLIFKN